MIGYDNEDLDESMFKLDRSVIKVIDKQEAWAQKQYQYYADMTPAKRIAHLEDLRRAAHGTKALNARFPRPIKFIERTWG